MSRKAHRSFATTELPATLPTPGKDTAHPLEPPLPSRYCDLGRIAAGASGEVRRVRDTLLDRTLAMKVLRFEHIESPRMRARFLTEARVTAQLEHPGIVAVHDQGQFDDGRLWFTMKEVRGTTLRSAIRALHSVSGPEAFGQTISGLSFRRLIDAFARVCQAVAYAHSQGIVHRDLKPDNIMVGKFGEALVMDWGIARRMAELVSTSKGDGLPATSANSSLTQHGDILGTPAYMPPEQAMGMLDRHGPWSDVYSLGAILYHLLTGRAPYEGKGRSVLRKLQKGPPPPIIDIKGPRAPEELVAVCERAMRRAIEERYPNAEALAREILAWLDGARRRDQALAIVEDARQMLPPIVALRARASERRSEARAILSALRPYDPIEQKRPGWQLEDEAARLLRDAALRETEWLQRVHAALSLDSELEEAHALLADHYRSELANAELEHEDEDAARFEIMLRTHDRGRYAGILRGEGALSLVTDPPGAEVQLFRYVERDRRLLPETMGVLGQTPLRETKLPFGRYLLVLHKEGYAEPRYPVYIERGEHWDGVLPGERDPYPILLPRTGDLDPDEIYVPAGPAWIGGDPLAVDSLPRQRVWVDAFVIGRFPVTTGQYLDFLNTLVAEGREAEALAACPRTPIGMDAEEHIAFARDDRGRFRIEESDPARLWAPDYPVFQIDWFAATAYARWLAEHTGRPYRLPHEIEREKAGRGVDSRFFPWGNHLDATFACIAESHRDTVRRASIHDYPLDESPYGARGLAGNSRDLCINRWTQQGPTLSGGRLVIEPASPEDPGFRAVKGGAWTSTGDFSRQAARFVLSPEMRRGTIGIRIARSFP